MELSQILPQQTEGKKNLHTSHECSLQNLTNTLKPGYSASSGLCRCGLLSHDHDIRSKQPNTVVTCKL